MAGLLEGKSGGGELSGEGGVFGGERGGLLL